MKYIILLFLFISTSSFAKTINIIAVGDLGDCHKEHLVAIQQKMVKTIQKYNYPVILLGDLGYPNLNPFIYNNCYKPIWGELKNVIPTVGNHDLINGNNNYFTSIFNLTKTYYKYSIDNQPIYIADSNNPNQQQLKWLDNNIKHSDACSIMAWHHPARSSGYHGKTPQGQPLWNIAKKKNIDIVLSGHDHHFEYIKNKKDEPTQFIVGTGGSKLYPVGLEIFYNSNIVTFEHGFLLLSITGKQYTWQFINQDGIVLKKGGNNCI